jgi:hypothetical protein
VTVSKPSPDDLTCSCGATAPAGALFCPMCAHPLGVNPNALRQSGDLSQESTPIDTRSLISLSNPDVIRSCYVSAILAALFGNLVYYLFFLWYPAAGVFSVYSYIRRTGTRLRTNDGVRLGLVTGILSFLVSLAIFTFVMLVTADPAIFGETIRQEIQSVSAPSDVKQQMLDILESPMALSFMLLASLTMSLTVAILLSIVGGVLGTKILSQD